MQPTETRRLKKDGKTHIAAQEYYHVLQDFGFNFLSIFRSTSTLKKF
jgi:hypothetical protein